MFTFKWTEGEYDGKVFELYWNGELYCTSENTRDIILLLSALLHIQDKLDVVL